MKTTFIRSIAISLCLCFASVLTAYSAYHTNTPVTVSQPDGSKINCFVTGDEYYNFLHTADGYVIKQNSDGYFYYMEKVGKQLEYSLYRVNQVNPALMNLTKWVAPDGDVLLKNRQEAIDKSRSPKSKSPQILTNPKTGQFNNLVLFIRFADQAEYTDPYSKYDSIFNAVTGVSFRNFYKEASYGKLKLTSYFYPNHNTTIVSYQDYNNRSYYSPYNATTNPDGYQPEDKASRENALLTNAIYSIQEGFPSTPSFDLDNDGKIDNITFLIQGQPDGWNSLLWDHRSYYNGSLTLQDKEINDYNFILSYNFDNPSTGVSVICHEFFHTLGAPDLYHYSYDGYVPVGSWDLMELNATPPQHMCCYSKNMWTGWVESIPEITVEGQYSLKPITSSTNNCYKIKSPNSTKEYLEVEYRKAEGTFEVSLPGSGLLVYRINLNRKSLGNSYGPPDEVYLFRPKGDVSSNGNINAANLCANVDRTEINDFTSPKAFLTNGDPMGIDIYDISSIGDSITFNVAFDSKTILTAPINSSTQNSITPKFAWRKQTLASSYTLQISTDNFFSTVLFQQSSITDTSYTLTGYSLNYYHKYFARVCWKNSTKTSLWSVVVNFTTIMDKPKNIYPQEACDTVSILSTFKWGPVEGANTYRLYISENSDMTNATYSRVNIADTEFKITQALKVNTKYYWKVIAVSSQGEKAESAIYSFTTKKTDLVIISQSNSQTVCPQNDITIEVTAAGDGIHYQWYKDNEIISNGTTKQLSFQSFNDTDKADYYCKIYADNYDDTLKCQTISLNELGKLSVVNEPENTQPILGKLATFSVTIAAENLSVADTILYQWFKAGKELADGGTYQGTKTDTLKITSVKMTDVDTSYQVRAISKCKDTVYSRKATLLSPDKVEDATALNPSVSLSPNPASDYFNINIVGHLNDHITIDIYNINGIVVSKLWDNTLQNAEITIPVNISSLNLTDGVYFVCIKSNSSSVTKKIEIFK